MNRRAVLAGLAFVGTALLTLSACGTPRAIDTAEESGKRKKDRPVKSDKPTLAVLVVVDQLRADLPKRWQALHGKGGFERLTNDGVWFTDCHYPYANTLTAAGHATVATGCSPDEHGIIANDWYSFEEGKKVNCVRTARGTTPERLLAPTIGDALKEHTKNKGKVVALAIKDRSAVLPAGKTPDAVYWTKDGQFVSEPKFYAAAAHDWVKKFNASGYADRWLGKEWTKYRTDVDYARYSGPDDVAAESDRLGLGRTFPHPLGKGKDGTMKNYYEAVNASPMGSELLLELAKRAIDAEGLGSRDTPDLLSISFSSNDLVGHSFGPDSQEVLDATLRTDEILRKLMSYLDEKVGKGKWTLLLTADHGICPLPEVAKNRPQSKNARRIVGGLKTDDAEKFLDAYFPPEEEKKEGSQGRWIIVPDKEAKSAAIANMLYLNRARVKARGTDVAAVSRLLAAWVTSQPGVLKTYTRAEIEGPSKKNDPILEQVKRSYSKERSGDVTVVVEPYCLMDPQFSTGTTHGSPHPYDTHVPLVIIGPNVKGGAEVKDRVSPELAAVLLSKALGMEPPEKAKLEAPKGLFGKK